MKSENIKVLLIDDDVDDFILTRELFSMVESSNYTLDWASTYEEGLKIAGRGEHHACLVDYRLGERTGIELIREARESRLTTPMILLTGQGDYDVDVEAMEAGATDFLVKDETSPARLERTIRYAVRINIERCRAEEELGAYAKKQAVVVEIGRLALIGTEIKELFAEAVSLVSRTLGVKFGDVFELLPDGNRLILSAAVGWKEEYRVGEAIVSAGKESQAGFTLLSDEPVIVEDFRTETRFSGTLMMHEHGIVSGMSVIIRGRERRYGILGVYSASMRRFGADDVNFLRSIANVLAEAIGRKRVEDEVSQSEVKFRALFENALDAVLIANDSGVYVDANPAACALLGVPCDEVIGRTVSNFIEKNYRAGTSGRWEQFLKDGTMRGEFRLQRSDGEIVEVEFSAMANFLPGRHLSMLRDVTERKQATEAVQRSEGVLRELAGELESERKRLVEAQALAKLGSWHTDLTTMEVIWSAETHRIFETDPALFHTNHRGFLQLVHPDDRATVEQAFAQSIDQCSMGEITHRVLMADGRIKFVEERWQIFHDEQQKPVRAAGTCMDITESKNAEEEKARLGSQLEAQSQRLNNIVASIPGVVWEAWGKPDSAAQNINFVSDYVETMLGYPVEEWLSTPNFWLSIVHPDDRERIARATAEHFTAGRDYTEEFRWVAKDGRVLWASSQTAIIRDGGGHPVGLRGINLDITERKSAEESVLEISRQLEATVESYRRVIDNSLDVICTIDGMGRFIQVSRASEDLWGYSSEELVGRAYIDLVHPDDCSKTNHAVTNVMAGHATRGFENRCLSRDGRAIDMLWSAVWSETEQNMFCVARDMSEIKHGEVERDRLLSELESERARLVDIFTHAPAFIALVRGPEHVYEMANTHYYDLVGRRDLIGKKVRSVFPEIEGQGFFELLDNVYATGVPFVGEEMAIEFTGAADVPRNQQYLNFVYQPLTETDGTVTGIICHGVDVTEQVLSRRRLEVTEDQLRQSQKLESVGMLAGGIAHDFNNLLTVITGYSELALRRLNKADPLARNVEEIKKAAERAASLTRQLLAFSRKQVLQPKVLDLNSVIANCEKMLGRLIGEDMELRTLPGAELGQVKADPGQIEQVIFNLVVNARDAMPKGGKITIETANIYLDAAYAARHIAVQPGWYAMLAVTDTGHGMDAETQKYIFEPFFTTKEQGKGTGLGLSTVYGIVKQSGGNLWVYSEVGVGTTFKVYLPLVNEQVAEPDAAAARPEKAMGTETILLAEDEEMVRNLACESLMMNGYTVLEAANAGEALLICKQYEGPIHLLLTDVVMPRMSGRELAEQLGSSRPEMRVLYMSGYPNQSIVHHGILDGEIAFIGKPFTSDDLARKVHEVIDAAPVC